MLCWNAMQAPGLAQARRKSRGSEMPRNWFCMKTQHWVLPLNFGKINGEGKTFTSRKWGRAWHLDKRHLQALLRTLFSSPLSLLHFRLQAKHVPELCNTDQRWPGLLPALPKSPSQMHFRWKWRKSKHLFVTGRELTVAQYRTLLEQQAVGACKSQALQLSHIVTMRKQLEVVKSDHVTPGTSIVSNFYTYHRIIEWLRWKGTSPKMDPWGISLVTSLHLDIELLTTTLWLQPSNQFFIHLQIHLFPI